MRKRVSLTLEEELVDRIDAEAERQGLNRSRAVEEMLVDYLDSRDIKSAAVLCGGGLDPSNRTLSELLDYLSGKVEKAFLVAGENTEELRQRFGEAFDGLELSYVEDPGEGQGKAVSALNDRVTGSFLVVNGDSFVEADLEEMLKVHREEASMVTVALTTVDDPSRFGAVEMKGRKVTGFREKPEPGEEPSKLVNTGFYIFEPEVLEGLDDLEEGLRGLSEEGLLTGYIVGGEWHRS